MYRWSAALVVAGVGLGLLRVHAQWGSDGLFEILHMAVTSIALLGKFVVFLGLREGSVLSPWGIALLVWLIDVLIAFALTSGLQGLEGAPVLGLWLRRARSRAVGLLARYPGLESMAFFGVTVLVMIPLAATGAVTGSFAGRLVGLSRSAGVVAIALGSAGTALTFALLASFIGEGAREFLQSPLLTGLLLLVLFLAARLAYGRIIDRLRKG